MKVLVIEIFKGLFDSKSKKFFVQIFVSLVCGKFKHKIDFKSI